MSETQLLSVEEAARRLVVYYRKKGDHHQVPEQQAASAAEFQASPKPYSSTVSHTANDAESYGLPGVFN